MRTRLIELLEVITFFAKFVSGFALIMAWFIAFDQVPNVERCCDETGMPYIGKSVIWGIATMVLFPISIIWGIISLFVELKILQGLYMATAILSFPVFGLTLLYLRD